MTAEPYQCWFDEDDESEARVVREWCAGDAAETYVEDMDDCQEMDEEVVVNVRDLGTKRVTRFVVTRDWSPNYTAHKEVTR